MAWAAQLSGDGAYFDFSVYDLQVGESLIIDVTPESGNSGGEYRIFGHSSTHLISMKSSSIILRIGQSGAGGLSVSNYTQPVAGQRFVLEIERDTTGYDVYLDGVFIGRNSTTTALSISRVGAIYTGKPGFKGLLHSLKLGLSRSYDPTASDHSNTGAQPVLVDTVGSNDATGSGFPTDGSAWVDLGGGGGEILDIDNGAFSLSGSDVLFMSARAEQALNGNYNLSGSDINFSIGYAINLDGGIYSLSGSATGLVLNANTVIESGEYSLAGTQANLDIARKSIIESGSYNLTGSDVTLIYTPGGTGESLFIDSGAFSLTGSDIGLKSTRLISVNSGSYNLTGQQISLTYNAKTIIDSGSYALIGSNVNLFANRVIIAINGSYTLSGTSVILKYSGDTYKTIGTVTAGFAQDKYSAEYKPTTITVNFKD